MSFDAEAVLAGGAWKIEVVKKPKDQKGFEVLPRRWVVERTTGLKDE